ncbi:MAG: DUF1295 domain-containing protein [Clostridia bacterium]|nr:DUF1295 domain-containing protein [Clostridia bacterium]
MVFTPLFWILVAVSAVLCCIGFYKFVWFMSVGYGLAVAGCGATMLISSLVSGQISIPYIIICILFIVYGCRLGLFLLLRELKNAAYRKKLDAQTSKPVPFFVKAAMWAMMAFLYPAQVSPVLFRQVNGGMTLAGDVCAWIGAVIMLIGVVIEAVADRQKSAQKKKNPHMAATKGLFRLCRCPNYFGEILVWTGCFVSGITAVKGPQWIMAVIGYVLIVYIMFSGAKRLEKRQNKNYGDNPEYIEYSSKTPILIPFIPVYHLVKKEK